MDKEQIARWSLMAALGAVIVGVLMAAVFTILLATLARPDGTAENFVAA